MWGRASFKVEFAIPQGATTAQMLDYIRDALSTERGLYPWSNPMAHFDVDSLVVTDLKSAQP